MLEDKTVALTLHYRSSDPTLVVERMRELRPLLRDLVSGHPLEIMDGAKVLEVRQRGANKGIVAAKLIANLEPGTAILAAGDDRTDEDMFAVLPSGAISIHVGPSRSAALHQLDTPAALAATLRSLLEPIPFQAGTRGGHELKIA